MFEIVNVENKKIDACCVIDYKGYSISLSTIFENQIAIFSDHSTEYYTKPNGNRWESLAECIAFVDDKIINNVR